MADSLKISIIGAGNVDGTLRTPCEAELKRTLGL
jgi:hypothetical protein